MVRTRRMARRARRARMAEGPAPLRGIARWGGRADARHFNVSVPRMIDECPGKVQAYV